MSETHYEPDIWQRLPIEDVEAYAYAENIVRKNIASHIARQATAGTLTEITAAALQVTCVTQNFELWTQDWLSIREELHSPKDIAAMSPETPRSDSQQLESSLQEVVRVRRLLGVSQRWLADESGISQPMLSRLENGQKSPTLPILRLARTALLRIAEEQDIPAATLFTDSPEDNLR